MVKVRMISRDDIKMTRERASDMDKVHRNRKERKFKEATEVKRAVNAAKLGKVFAKPFVGQLEGHLDTITAMRTSPRSVDTLVSGSADGELRVWSMARKAPLWTVEGAHRSFVTGIVLAPNGESFFSASSDRSIKQWKLDMRNIWAEDVDSSMEQWVSDYAISGMDGHRSRYLLATGSRQIDIWDTTRSTPIQTMAFSDDTMTAVKFSPVETEILAATATDRSLSLYDIREESAVRKIETHNVLNDVDWNPMEAFILTVASDDHNLYTFDIRKLNRAVTIHTDHVSAVMSVGYAPTGKNFVSGSYDKTVRTWDALSGRSTDTYHTKRMQRVFTVSYTADARYVLSGSDDASIRLWRAKASQRTQILAPKQKATENYNARLLARYQHIPAVGNIYKRRNEPTNIKKARKLRHIMRAAANRKRDRQLRSEGRLDDLYENPDLRPKPKVDLIRREIE